MTIRLAAVRMAAAGPILVRDSIMAVHLQRGPAPLHHDRPPSVESTCGRKGIAQGRFAGYALQVRDMSQTWTRRYFLRVLKLLISLISYVGVCAAGSRRAPGEMVPPAGSMKNGARSARRHSNSNFVNLHFVLRVL